ncbi:uracil-DNA glycosylase [Methylovulum psychrotolerans]|uniref:uracil-DNA glycosylase n=1 Tax=Methylovulum psychrotolerans TaxID=1704499 RepID=UPI001BFFB8F7|nr:uracil-DNA glycosylase [Methylovulum psychrotolerans]MBT9098233.1 uracil-DNA glycosylase [Methylovulum psychrotolerans]
MDNTLRLHYLEAMGIDVWLPRAASVVPELSAAEPVPPLPEPQALAELPAPPEPQPLADIGAADAGADNWEVLAAEVAACTRCGLCNTRKNTVFGSGDKMADWLLIGEGPGQHEDEQGLPFVGNAGQLLTEMIRALGLSRDEVFITNIVKCRPPNNRDPHVDEVASCQGYLQRQIALIRPKIILAVGRIAAQTLLATDAPLGKLRGKVHTLHGVPVVVVYHPAYLLRSLPEKRKAWQDLQLALHTVKAQQ